MSRPAANARQAGAALAGLLTGVLLLAATVPAAAQRNAARRNNVILFVGDGMDVSTVTFSRIAEHGVDGDLFMDRMPYTALSRTSSADDLVADSAAAMSAMMTGVNTNNGVIGYRGTPLTNVAELAKSLGYAVGIVTTARVTDATPAAVYAHVRDRGPEDDVAAQLVPGGAGYNARLGSGLDVILGGGQMHFLPWTRPDDRDLRAELQAQGYAYVDDAAGLEALGAGSRVLGLFTWSHMSAELYRGSREPGIVDMTAKAIEVLAATGRPYFLMVESGRIDGAHHAGNAFVAFVETRELDRAIGAAIEAVDLDRTLIMATADHGHVLTVAGSMVRPVGELPYAPRSAPASFTGLPYHGVFGTAHDIDGGVIGERLDSDGVPYTLLGYANGPGHREGPRVDPNSTPGVGGGAVVGTSQAWYHQEATVPRKLETHGGVDVAVHAIGSTAENVRGTVRNTQVFHWIAAAFGETAAADPAREAAGSFPAPSPRVAAPSPGVEAPPAGAADGARAVEASGALRDPGGDGSTAGPAGRNDVILFVGDGMGLSTVTFSRIAGHGVDGDLFLDRMPYTALSRTASADHIAGDSAAAMTAMMTGVRSSSGVIGYPPATERLDFNRDGDGPPLTNVAELAKSLGYAVGIVTTAGVTDATPAAVYAHVNDRDRENDVAAQLVPGGAGYNARLGGGLDVVFGGGRRHFVPAGATDGEGGAGRRTDGRDLRVELQAQGYAYVWNRDGFEALGAGDRAVGLFAPRHMEYEFDRGDGTGNEPGIVGMTVKAIEILASTGRPYFLMVESGRIDHAHRAGNAFRAFVETRELDRAIGAAIEAVDLDRTLIVATADHGHPLTIAAGMVQPLPASLAGLPYHGMFATAHERRDRNRVPYTVLGYAAGPGHREGPRVDPNEDRTPGWEGAVPASASDAAYLQEATVPRSSGIRSADDVAVYAIGRTAENVRGTVPNTRVFDWITAAFGPATPPAANRAPEAAGTLPGLAPGVADGARTVEVSGAFRDPDGDTLTWAAVSSSPEVATVSVSGSVLTVTPLAAGETTVTVTATDAGGSGGTATQSFRVTVPEEEHEEEEQEEEEDARPNVVLIMADDVGHEAFGAYGNAHYRTPRIDRLADEGVRFTHAYSHPACTPSRVALMTGKSNVRNYADFGVLLPGQYTIADLFEEAGYATAIAGKWQLHGSSTVAGTPAGAGFDTYCLWQTANTGDSRYWGPSIECDGEIIASTSDDYGPDMFTDFLLEFIESNRDGPFFAYYPMVLPHSPFVPPPQSTCPGDTNQCNYEEMVGRLDYNVGRIHDKLAELELLDTTLVFFTSDNGTPRHVASWFEEELIYGDKRVPTDGGTRVPLIARGPVSGGRVLDDLIDFTDFLPTLADAAGVTLPEDAARDGVSFWDRLQGGEGRPREWIHTYYFSDPYVREFATPSSHHEISYARDRRYKLYGTGELFDVPADRHEVHPLPGDDEASRAARARLQAALDSMPARGREIRWPQVTASASTTDPFLRWRPVLSRATVDGAELTLAYAGVLNTDAAPPARSFGVRVDGAEREVVAVSMSAGAVTLTLGAAVTAGQTVTVMYNPAGSRSISHANRDGGNRAAPLYREAVTNETRNRPPAPVGTLAPVMLPVGGGAAAVDAAAAFRDEEGDTLTWAAVSSSPEVATVSVSGSTVTVTPLAVGETTVTVTVTDAGGSGGTAAQSFRVTVPQEDVGVDYDADDDGLIEIATLAQLDAVRHDLDGDGVPAGSGAPPAAGTGAASGAAAGSGAAGSGTAAAGTAAAAGSGTTAAGSGTAAAGASAASSGAAAAAGSGEALPRGAAAHAAAFPDAAEGMGCPSGGCLGYELAADLDFDTDGSGAADAGDAFWNGGAGWRPLGTFDEPFTGVFSGNGRTVSHLFVGGGDNAGLFGLSSGVIRGVGVVAADVTGSQCAGALAGLNGGRVEASWSTGAVTGDSCVGGLVGVNGLWVPDGGTFRPLEGFVTASWSSADATAEKWVGGLVGYDNGTVVASYATGAVTATTEGSGAGGLVGRMGFGGNRITASYATGAVSGPGGSVGGLVGHAMPHDRVEASYWDTETSGVTRGGGGSGRTTAALQEPTGYTGLYAAWDVDADGDGLPDAPWDFGTPSAYPALAVDADGDGAATRRELGLQGRAVPAAAESGGGAPGAGVKAGTSPGGPPARAQAGDTAARGQARPAFTDDPLVPGVTPVRAAHLLELRARIDALRRRAGLPAFGWTDAKVVPGVTPARALHLTELRSALGEAYAAAGRPAPGYTDAVVTAGVTAMRALQLQELRRAVVALEGASVRTVRK